MTATAPKTRKLHVVTHGCQMNVYDSARMADVLAPLGYATVDAPEGADMVIMNTCHIRERAAEKVFSALGRLRDLKEETGGNMMIAVTGCVRHLPLDAADDRPLRVLPRADPALEHDLDLRLPLPREGRPRPCRRSPSRSPAGSPTCRRRSTRGSTVDEFAPRLAFFFNGHNDVFQEVAKFRAARRMWARIMRERFGARKTGARRCCASTRRRAASR